MFEAIRKATVSAVLNIFETMYFTFLEPMGENLQQSEEVTEQEKESDLLPLSEDAGWLKSEIHFNGPNSGFLRLFIPYDFSEMLTKNFMGFEEEVTESQILDMAGELTNMICGNLFSSLDKSSVYTLSSPSTQKMNLQEKLINVASGDLVLNFITEGWQVAIDIQFENPNGVQAR
jgi:hypothetical protein